MCTRPRQARAARTFSFRPFGGFLTVIISMTSSALLELSGRDLASQKEDLPPSTLFPTRSVGRNRSVNVFLSRSARAGEKRSSYLFLQLFSKHSSEDEPHT